MARLQPIPQVDQYTVFYRVHVDATSRTTTRLGLLFRSSAVALRLGGGLIPVEEGLRGGLDGKLHRNVLRELPGAPELRDARFLAALLWPDARR